MGVKPWETIDELSKSGKLPMFDSKENFQRIHNSTHAYHGYVVVAKLDGNWKAMEDVTKGGTWVKFDTPIKCRSVLMDLESSTTKTWAVDFLCPVLHRDEGKAGSYLLYPQVFITWDEWVTNLLEDLPSNSADLAVSTFCQVMRKVKDMHGGKADCFSVINKSIGITQTNKVVFINSPRAGKNFNQNIRELSDMANKLATGLPAFASHSGIKMMMDFHQFISTTYNDMCNITNWQSKQLIKELRQYKFRLQQNLRPLPQLKAELLSKGFVRECLALNHPIWYQSFDTLRFFNNLGLLTDKSDPRCLGSNDDFKHVILRELSQWTSMLAQDQRLKEILNFTMSTNQTGPVYAPHDILHCFTNAIKHYWERGSIFLSKEQVCMLIEHQLMSRVSCTLIRAFGEAVMNGYLHHEYNVEAVFYPRKGTFL